MHMYMLYTTGMSLKLSSLYSSYYEETQPTV